MQPEVIAARKQRKSPRSVMELELEILKELENKDLKKTAIAGKAEINYMLATSILEDIEKRKLITRNREDGIYSITTKGLQTIEIDKIDDDTKTEIITIAMNMAEKGTRFGKDCQFCKKENGQHDENCEIRKLWKSLKMGIYG